MVGEGLHHTSLHTPCIATSSQTPELPFFVFFCETSHLHGGMLSSCLDLGILVSRHICRCFPDAFKIRKKTLPSKGSTAECSLTLQGRIELGHDGFNDYWKDFHLLCAIRCSVLVPVIHTMEIGDDIAGVSLSPDRIGGFLLSKIAASSCEMSSRRPR